MRALLYRATTVFYAEATGLMPDDSAPDAAAVLGQHAHKAGAAERPMRAPCTGQSHMCLPDAPVFEQSRDFANQLLRVQC
jgi:hypothetical protein